MLFYGSFVNQTVCKLWSIVTNPHKSIASQSIQSTDHKYKRWQNATRSRPAMLTSSGSGLQCSCFDKAGSGLDQKEVRGVKTV